MIVVVNGGWTIGGRRGLRVSLGVLLLLLLNFVEIFLGRRDSCGWRGVICRFLVVKIVVIIVVVVEGIGWVIGGLRGSGGGRGGGMLLLRAPRGRDFPGGCGGGGFLLRLLRVSAIRLVTLIIVLLAAVPAVVEVAGAASAQNVPRVARLILVVAVRAAQRVARRAYWVVAFTALQVVLRLGVAPHAVVVQGLQARAYPVEIEIVAGVIEGCRLAVDVIPVRAGLTLLIKCGVIWTEKPVT